MSSDLVLIVRREEAVLVRVLGLVVRRGFEPVRVLAHLEESGQSLRLEMTVEGDRSVEVLMRQLSRLNEVQRVELNSPDTGR